MIMLGLLAAFVGACTGNKNNSHPEGFAPAMDTVTYTCPMHPEIIRDAPGSCPVCGMDLVKKESGNLSLQDIELDALLRPSNQFVVSAIPLTAIQLREEDVELNVVGKVEYDTRQTRAISSRVKGRIERLYIRYRYQPIQKGQRVLDIYSPDLVTAQQNLIFLLQNDPGNTSLISAAKERLVWMGMTTGQVAQVVQSKRPQYSVPVFSNYSGYATDLSSVTSSMAEGFSSPFSPGQELSIREGMYVQSGQAIFSIYDPSRAWILLDIFPEQQGLIKNGDAVRIVPETAPHRDFRAKINYLEPVFRSGAKTLSARVYFNNASLRLPIGSRVKASIFASSRAAFWLAKESVLSLGRDKIVFRKEGSGFRAHRVVTGMQLNGYIQVSDGLLPTDSVASNAQFLIDNESFIKVENK